MLIVFRSSTYVAGNMERLCLGYGPNSGVIWSGLTHGDFDVVQ
jgi:hypothetical protein